MNTDLADKEADKLADKEGDNALVDKEGDNALVDKAVLLNNKYVYPTKKLLIDLRDCVKEYIKENKKIVFGSVGIRIYAGYTEEENRGVSKSHLPSIQFLSQDPRKDAKGVCDYILEKKGISTYAAENYFDKYTVKLEFFVSLCLIKKISLKQYEKHLKYSVLDKSTGIRVCNINLVYAERFKLATNLSMNYSNLQMYAKDLCILDEKHYATERKVFCTNLPKDSSKKNLGIKQWESFLQKNRSFVGVGSYSVASIMDHSELFDKDKFISSTPIMAAFTTLSSRKISQILKEFGFKNVQHVQNQINMVWDQGMFRGYLKDKTVFYIIPFEDHCLPYFTVDNRSLGDVCMCSLFWYSLNAYLEMNDMPSTKCPLEPIYFMKDTLNTYRNMIKFLYGFQTERVFFYRWKHSKDRIFNVVSTTFKNNDLLSGRFKWLQHIKKLRMNKQSTWMYRAGNKISNK